MAQLTAAAEQAGALQRDGRLAAAAACLAAADAAAQGGGAAPPRVPHELLAAQAAQRAALCGALRDALAARVACTLDDGGGGGCVRVQRDGAEPLPALWDALEALGAAGDAAQALAAALLERLLLPLLHAPQPLALTADEGSLSWRAAPSGGGGGEPPFAAAATALRFLGRAALGTGAGGCAALGAALAPGLGAAATQHARVPAAGGDDVADEAWERAAAGAALLEAAAAEARLLPADAAPLSAAVLAARAQAEAAARGAWLAAARACVMRADGDTLRVGGAWRADAAAMALADGAADAAGALCFPACRVSCGALALARLLDRHLAVLSPPAARARHARAAAECADMLRAVAPCARAAALEAAPGAAMLLRNDAHFLAFRLAGGAAAACAPQLAGVAAALCATGDALLAAALEAASADAAVALDADFADAAAPERRAAIERALAGALHAERRLRALAVDTLPADAADAAAAAVLGAVGHAAAAGVLAVRDIGVHDGAALCAVLSAALAQHAGSAAPGWRKLARVRALLEAPLASIAADAEAGALPELSARELAALVRAVFGDSATRADALRRIEARRIHEL